MLTSVFALAVVAAPAAAQSEWLAAEGTSIALEFRHPSFSEEDINDEMDLLDGAWFLSGRVGVPVLGAAAVAEIPFVRSGFGDGYSSIGNVYLGGEMPLMLGALTAEVGVRLPTASEPDDFEEALVLALVGILPTMVDRYDAFVPDAFTPRVGLRAGMSATPLISVEANVAGAYMIYTGDVEDTDNEFFLDYGARAFAGLAATRIGLGLEGAFNATNEDEDELGLDPDGESTLHHIGLWLDHEFGMVRPGVSLFLPLGGDYADALDYTLGVSVEVDLPF